MRKFALIAALMGGFFVSGCETFIAAAITDAQAAHRASYDYVAWNIRTRRQVREKCRDLVLREVDRLTARELYAEARALLAKHYPPLVTMGIAEDGAESLNRAGICG